MKKTLLLLLFAGLTARADVPIHHYAKSQLPAVRELKPTEAWRLGGFDDEFLLGVIASALVDDDGNVYLLDSQLSEIHVFDPQGNHLRSFGREGEGPGEFQRAGGMLWVGANLCIIQRFPARLVQFTREGDPAGDLHLAGVEGMGGVSQGQVQGDHWVFAKSLGRRGDNGFTMIQTLARHGQDGSERSVIESSEFEVDLGASSFREGDMIGFENNWVLFPDGTVVLGRSLDRYELQFRGVDGTPRSTTTVEYAALPRTAEEKENVQGGPRMMVRGGGRSGGPKFVPRDDHPVFSELRLGPDGRLWALSTRGARPEGKGQIAQYDVFTSDGKLAERVGVLVDGSMEEDALLFAPGHMILIRGYRDALRAFFAGFGGPDVAQEDPETEPEPLEIVVYRI